MLFNAFYMTSSLFGPLREFIRFIKLNKLSDHVLNKLFLEELGSRWLDARQPYARDPAATAFKFHISQNCTAPRGESTSVGKHTPEASI